MTTARPSSGTSPAVRTAVGCNQPAKAPLERKAKRATNVSYVPAALATGNCDLVPNAFATRILVDGTHVRGVRWRDTETGEIQEAEAGVVVLAGGSVESPRLWLNSNLPNTHDVVGRHFTMHLQDFVTGFLESGKARGRPVAVAFDKSGALLIADDVGNTVWRVSGQ